MSRVSAALRTTGPVAVLVGVLVLSGCTVGSVPETTSPIDRAPSALATSPNGMPAPDPAASADPALAPNGTATDNLALFAAVTAQVWASESRYTGRAYIDALVAAGFPREAMQVTEDETTVGNPVESLQFSVAWGVDECLVGQVGPSTGAPVTAVMPQLAEGRCLVGATRPIGW